MLTSGSRVQKIENLSFSVSNVIKSAINLPRLQITAPHKVFAYKTTQGTIATSTSDLLGDTHGVFTLADERLSVVLSLRPDSDQLEGVGPGTELSVGWLHLTTDAVGQVDATHWVLDRHEPTQRNVNDN